MPTKTKRNTSRSRKKTNRLAFLSNPKKLTLLIFCLIFACLGIRYLLQSHAATVGPGDYMPTDMMGFSLKRNGPDAFEEKDMVTQAAQVKPGWVRISFNWNNLEQTGPNVDFATGSRKTAIREAKAKGMKVIGVIAYAPTGWSDPVHDPGCTQTSTCRVKPGKEVKYADFATKAAEYFNCQNDAMSPANDCVDAWELWNEPTGPQYNSPGRSTIKQNADEYAKLVVASYDRMKAKSPNATIVVGALSCKPNPLGAVDFLRQALIDDDGPGTADVSIAGKFDALSHHPYNFSNAIAFTNGNQSQIDGHDCWKIMYANGSDGLEAVMQQHGGIKPIWMTEYGYPSAGTSSGIVHDQAKQKQAFINAMKRWMDYKQGINSSPLRFGSSTDHTHSTGPFFYFNYYDLDSTGLESDMGLVQKGSVGGGTPGCSGSDVNATPTGNAKAAFCTFKFYPRTTGGTPPNSPPTVSLTSPASGSTISGTITFSASATDSDGSVTKVNFSENAIYVGQDTSPPTPFTFSWDTNSVPDGNYTLTAKAFDDDGASTVSTGVPVTVKNAGPKVACNNGADDDSDGKIDYPADPGCSSATDTDEYNAPAVACNDGVDNDSDGLIDLADPGCTGATDTDEYNKPAAPADLIVTALSVTPPTQYVDQATNFSVTIKNQGGTTVPAATNVVIAFKVNGTQVATGTIPSGTGIVAGEEKSITVSNAWTPTSSGSVTLQTVADATNVVPNEGDETNNTRSVNLTVNDKVVDPPPVPGKPSGLHETTVTSTTVAIDWNDVSGADWYSVERDGQEIGAPTTSSYVDTNGLPDTQYTYRVLAHANGQTQASAPSDTITVRTNKQPINDGGGNSGGGGTTQPTNPITIRPKGSNQAITTRDGDQAKVTGEVELAVPGTTIDECSKSLDTSTLTNGVHEIEIKCKQGSVDSSIVVANKLNWFERLRNLIFKPFGGMSGRLLNGLMAGFSLLLLAIVGYIAYRQRNTLGYMFSHLRYLR